MSLSHTAYHLGVFGGERRFRARAVVDSPLACCEPGARSLRCVEFLRGGATTVHLLLGDPESIACQELRDALEARGHASRMVSNPLADPWRFCWSLSSDESQSSLRCDGQEAITSEDIASVFVQSTGWIDPSGWRTSDLTYTHAETQAALVSWLWSLECPVVNRYPAAPCYQPDAPLLYWHTLFGRYGLSAPESLVTNAEHEARAFGERLSDQGRPVAVCGALTSQARYLVSDEAEWAGVAALQRISPVYLIAPHGETRAAWVVGNRVIWEEPPSTELTTIEPSLLSFTVATGLSLLEFRLAMSSGKIRVVALEPRPRLDGLRKAIRKRIVDEIARLLIAGERNRGRTHVTRHDP